MITPVKACELAAAIYKPIAPYTFTGTWTIDGVTVGYTLIGGFATFTFAGSECVSDWVRDFKAIPFNHPQLGWIHAGMWEGMDAVFSVLRPFLVGPIAITGHSLGCAHASFLAALCAVAGISVSQVFLFAPPRPGYKQMREILAAHVGRIYAYRNGEDPVPEMAPALLGDTWCDVADLIALNEKPEFGDFNPLGFHAIGLYLAGVKKMGAMEVPITMHGYKSMQ